MSQLTQSEAIATYKRLLLAVRPYVWLLGVGLVATMFGALVDAGLAWCVKPVVDKGFIAREVEFLKLLPLAVFMVFVLRGVTSFASNYCLSRTGRLLVMEFRQKIFHKLLSLPANYYDQQSSGQLLSKMIYNVEQIAEATTTALLTLVQEGFLAIGLLGVMFVINWRLTLMFLVAAPIIALIFKVTSKRMRHLSRWVQDSMAEVSHIAEEAIEGYKVIRTYGGEHYERAKFNKATTVNRQRELKVVVTNALGTMGSQLAIAVPIALILYLATQPSLGVSTGSFAAVVAAMLSIRRPLRRLSRVNGLIQKGIAGAQSIFDLLDEPVEQDTGVQPLTRAKGHIHFRHVDFVYPESQRPVLTDISFSVQPGETVALVGKSGAGKSTLISLLPRFYEVSRGAILVDKLDIREYRLADLRQQFALVSQDVTLFNDTILHNIAYGREADASKADVVRAAEMANAMEFIHQLPEGLQTMVGEDGVLLSGGQRQRIAIARAILRDAPIIILDEATSALDSESERHIQAALMQLTSNRTTLVIAHRLSTIEQADKILVIDDGKLVESGTHTQLIAHAGCYAHLHAMQFANSPQAPEPALVSS